VIEPNIHGVPAQTIMIVCERIHVLGHIIRRHPTLHALEIMGVKFLFEENAIQRGYQNMREIHLRGEDWEVWMRSIRFVPEYEPVEWNVKAGATTSWPKPRKAKALPDDVVRWGREAYYQINGLRFDGDEETFKKNMVIAKMLGDLADWQHALDAFKS
jgi:hypothetical protein